MKYTRGDLVAFAKNGDFDVIVHGCNCFHTMGAGIAYQIKQTWPSTYETDCVTTKYADKEKLGTASCSFVEGGKLVVVNAYTQYSTGGLAVDYDAVRSVFKWIKKTFPNSRIGIPQIGAGLAGGDWNIIEKIIDEETKECDITCVIYKM